MKTHFEKASEKKSLKILFNCKVRRKMLCMLKLDCYYSYPPGSCLTKVKAKGKNIGSAMPGLYFDNESLQGCKIGMKAGEFQVYRVKMTFCTQKTIPIIKRGYKDEWL